MRGREMETRHILRKAQPRERAEEVFRRPASERPGGSNETLTLGPTRGVKSQPGAGVIQRGRDFRRLANKRVPQAGEAILAIATLSNTKNYKYTPQEVEQIRAYLQETLDTVIARFMSPEQVAPAFELTEDEE